MRVFNSRIIHISSLRHQINFPLFFSFLLWDLQLCKIIFLISIQAILESGLTRVFKLHETKPVLDKNPQQMLSDTVLLGFVVVWIHIKQWRSFSAAPTEREIMDSTDGIAEERKGQWRMLVRLNFGGEMQEIKTCLPSLTCCKGNSPLPVTLAVSAKASRMPWLWPPGHHSIFLHLLLQYGFWISSDFFAECSYCLCKKSEVIQNPYCQRTSEM